MIRRQRNRIRSILRSDGVVVTSQHDIGCALVCSFRGRWNVEEGNADPDFLDAITWLVSAEDNLLITRSITWSEIY